MPPGTRNALVPPSPNYLRDAGQFVGGVGRGLANQFVISPLQMVQQSYEDPYSLGQGIYEGARGLVADPVGVVGNSLRSMWNRAKSSPAGLGEVVGENIDPRNWLKPRKALRKELDVYHGTPHTFDPEEGAPLGRFRSQKIGTGEGAQAYGYGLYLAEDPKVAGYYKRMDSPFASSGLKGVPATVAALAKQDAPGGPENAAKFLRENYDIYAKQWGKQEVDTALKSLESGSLYKVDLPDAKIEQMLDWDKPLSQQPKSVREALASLGDTQDTLNAYDDSLLSALQGNGQSPGKMPRNPSGEDIVTQLQKKYGKQGASEYLRSLGIPGIKYLDAGSRAGEKGTRNFVVFPGEEQSLNILSRD